MFSFESLVDDMAMLVYSKELKGFMSNNQRNVYFKALGRVQEHGQKLFDAQVAQLDYEALKQRVTEFEVQNPSVVK
jgi:hypothetical protein